MPLQGDRDRERCLWWRTHALWRQVTVLHTEGTQPVFQWEQHWKKRCNSGSSKHLYHIIVYSSPVLVEDMWLWVIGRVETSFENKSGMYLQGTSSGHSFVSIQRGVQLLPKEFADSLFESWDPGSSTHYLNCIDVVLFQFLWSKNIKKKL